MKDNTIPFKLFANCVPVKGVSRSTICDLQRNKIHLIPNVLFDILEQFQGDSIQSVKRSFNNEYNSIIDEYFSFLEEEELIFYTSSPKSFPLLNLQWHYPFIINNAILDVNKNSNFSFDKILKSLSDLSCKFFEIRSYYTFTLKFFQDIINHMEGTSILSVSILMPYNSNISLDSYENFCDQNERITRLSIYDSPTIGSYYSPKFLIPISYYSEKIFSEKCCGKISQRDFVSHIETFTESHHHNSCLNRKVSIDIEGNIKNCPSMKENFGNIRDSTLEEAINKPGFKKYWNITKDQIDTCKDCEFRYVCTDCRAYLEDPEDDYSKPLKCGYNPYTCEWEEWSTHPMKRKAIRHYGMCEFIKTT